jgi:hypothetical protein
METGAVSRPDMGSEFADGTRYKGFDRSSVDYKESRWRIGRSRRLRGEPGRRRDRTDPIPARLDVVSRDR